MQSITTKMFHVTEEHVQIVQDNPQLLDNFIDSKFIDSPEKLAKTVSFASPAVCSRFLSLVCKRISNDARSSSSQNLDKMLSLFRKTWGIPEDVLPATIQLIGKDG